MVIIADLPQLGIMFLLLPVSRELLEVVHERRQW
jgi:hypothetical protein